MTQPSASFLWRFAAGASLIVPLLTGTPAAQADGLHPTNSTTDHVANASISSNTGRNIIDNSPNSAVSNLAGHPSQLTANNHLAGSNSLTNSARGIIDTNPQPSKPPLQPAAVGPMWGLSLTGPWPNSAWGQDPQFNQHAADGGRINVPTPTVDFQFPIQFVDATSANAGNCLSDSDPNCVAGDFGLYTATIEQCLNPTDAAAFGLSPAFADGADNCVDSENFPNGQWYELSTNTTTLLGSNADPGSQYVGRPAGQAPQDGTANQTLTTETKLPKIMNVLRIQLQIGLGDSHLPCGPGQFNCGICSLSPSTSQSACDNGLIQFPASITTRPMNVVVVPAVAAQLRLLPYTILYAPPGDSSNSGFSTTLTFTNTITAGKSTAINNTTKQESWLQYGSTDGFNLSVPMGGDGVGVGITDTGTYNTSQTTKWDRESTSGTGNTVSSNTENGLQVSTSYGEVLTSNSKNHEPGPAGNFQDEPFWSDRIVALRHPQFGIWDFDGQAQMQLIGSRGSPLGGPEWVDLQLRDLDACANGSLKLVIPPDNEVLTADECRALASLDPFWSGGGQSSLVGLDDGQDHANQRGLFLMSSNYGMGADARPGDLPLTITDTEIKQAWKKSTISSQQTYTATVQDILATQSSAGLDLSGSVDLGLVKVGASNGFTVQEGENDTTNVQMTLTYSSSNATQLQQNWSLTAAIGDDHIGLKDGNGQPYLPFVEVFQDKAFGGLMYRDPAAACNPTLILCHAASGVHLASGSTGQATTVVRERVATATGTTGTTGSINAPLPVLSARPPTQKPLTQKPVKP